MRYDFDEIIPRRRTCSYKWDSASDDDVLPMWVADMDFRTAPAIQSALQRRVEHGIFGYTKVPDAYYEAIICWFKRRHGGNIRRDWILYTPGVVPAISAIIKALVRPTEGVLVQTPVYNCFFSSIRNNGCRIVASPLLRNHLEYQIDYVALERDIVEQNVRLMLLCNPHNPVGRVWSREELLQIGKICLKHDVIVVSDEIHGELVYPGYTYTPFASLSADFLEHSVTCTAPTKAFNIAGLQIANIVVANPEWRKRIDRAININEVCDVNPLGVEALIAAYNEGEEWLSALLEYLYANYLYMQTYGQQNFPQFPIGRLEGTYLVWMDCSELGVSSEALEHQLLENVKLWLNAGAMYGETERCFLRWNIACPRPVLADGLERFARFVATL